MWLPLPLPCWHDIRNPGTECGIQMAAHPQREAPIPLVWSSVASALPLLPIATQHDPTDHLIIYCCLSKTGT